MKISTILDHIDSGHMALPEFQRGYVWNRDQVRGLFDSLYRRHPVGGLLVWATESQSAAHRGDGPVAAGVVKLLLDGQQRVTSLYGVARGQPPKFFDGNAQAFTGLRFHLERETFAFWQPVKMGDDPLWIDVTALMKRGQAGHEDLIEALADHPEVGTKAVRYSGRISRILGILDIELHEEQLTGADKSLDVVVDIFNRVNSGGTKLSKGDLALAKICADWPEGRDAMKAELKRWEQDGYHFNLDWLLRSVNTVLTGEAKDWGTGLPLKAHLLGKLSRLEVHHIFPKAQLYKRNYGRPEVNALGNFCFLTKDTNLDISATLPEVYFPQVEEHHPGALASQWIPQDPELWRIDRFRDFLEARKTLLAEELNRRMADLLHGDERWLAGAAALTPEAAAEPAPQPVEVVGGISSEAEETQLEALNDWVAEQGLPRGTLAYDLADPDTGAQQAVLDLASLAGRAAGRAERARGSAAERRGRHHCHGEPGRFSVLHRGRHIPPLHRDRHTCRGWRFIAQALLKGSGHHRSRRQRTPYTIAPWPLH
jgi:hypothetical protein